MLSVNSVQKLKDFFRESPIRYRKKDIILHPDTSPNSIFFIKSGYIRAYRISESGEELTLIILKTGDLFPITAGIQDLQNNYYVEAITSVEIVKASKDDFSEFLKTNPDVLYELTNDILSRFGTLLTRMEYLIVSHAYEKVASTLLICAQNFGEQRGLDVVLKLPLTHKDIANLAGITRETTCLEMKKLEKKGLIGRLGRLFVVKDIKKLEEELLISTTYYNDY